MTRAELATAGEHLTAAAERTDGETAQRLQELADQLESLAAAESGPDHGRLARIQAALKDVRADAGADAAASIDDADDAINDYREDLEGV
jgi:hypothetical protein